MYGVDRKICHEGHWSASRGLPSDAEKWSRVTDFSIHTIHPWKRFFTFWLTTFDLQSRTCYKVTLFSFKDFLVKFKSVDATRDPRSGLYVSVLFALSDVIFWRNGCKNQRHLTA